MIGKEGRVTGRIGPGLVGEVSWTVGWASALWGVGLYWFACLLYLEQVARIVRRERRAPSPA